MPNFHLSSLDGDTTHKKSILKIVLKKNIYLKPNYSRFLKNSLEVVKNLFLEIDDLFNLR